MAYDIRIGMNVRAPREHVFPFLLTPHHLARWFCNFAVVQPTVGGRFRFGGDYAIVAHPDEGGAWETTIRAGEVLRRFAFSWPLWDAATEVELSVEDRDGGSAIRLSHLGLPRATSTCGSLLDAWRICLANLKAVAEGREDSLRPDSSPIAGSAVKLDVLVNAPAARTFEALTRPDALDRWAAKHARVDATAGGAYGFGWPAEDGRLVQWDPPRALEARWSIGSQTIGTTLEVEAKGTDRCGVHFGLRDWAAGAVEFAKAQRGLWSSRLVDLKNFLEAGEVGFAEAYDAQLTARPPA